MSAPRVSIVIPILNEGQTLRALYARVAAVMGAISGGAEAIVVDDGSTDGTIEQLRDIAARDPRVRVISFNRNYGQRAAVFAALGVSRGRIVVTIDGDLQNPPEDIPKLVAKIDEGFEVVGGWRQQRHDTPFRRLGSRLYNLSMRGAVRGFRFNDLGCMMRAYARPVVDAMLQSGERSPYLPALSCQFTRRIAEVPVGHAERAVGTSQYSLFSLIRLQIELWTTFSTAPIKGASTVCVAIGIGWTARAVIDVVRWLLSDSYRWWDILGLAVVLSFGAFFFVLALIVEYIGRIHTEVRHRPRSVIAERINID